MVEREARPFFYGRCEHRINDKGQVAMPARFRAVIPEPELDKGFVLVRGEAPCLYCYTHAQFRSIVDRVMSDDQTRADPDFLRDFFEDAHAVDVDAQGRLVIPAALREAAQIRGDTVVFLGHNDRVEIWDARIRGSARSASEPATQEKRAGLARRIFGP